MSQSLNLAHNQERPDQKSKKKSQKDAVEYIDISPSDNLSAKTEPTVFKLNTPSGIKTETVEVKFYLELKKNDEYDK